jgi:hypothetical protein
MLCYFLKKIAADVQIQEGGKSCADYSNTKTACPENNRLLAGYYWGM